jgi:hypothetical protein
MAIAESRRLTLFESAKTSWGEDTAQTLMDLLPPDPMALATKSDLAVLGSELRVEMADLRSETAKLGGDLRSEMAQQARLLMITTLSTTVTIVLAVLGAALAT